MSAFFPHYWTPPSPREQMSTFHALPLLENIGKWNFDSLPLNEFLLAFFVKSDDFIKNHLNSRLARVLMQNRNVLLDTYTYSYVAVAKRVKKLQTSTFEWPLPPSCLQMLAIGWPLPPLGTADVLNGRPLCILTKNIALLILSNSFLHLRICLLMNA